MAAINLKVNGKSAQVDVDPQMPLLWVIRDYIGLTGTKFSCGISVCGACTVLMDGAPVRSCVLPVSAVEGKNITTIEGLSQNNDHPGAKGLDRRAGSSMWVLPIRTNFERSCAAKGKPRPIRSGNRNSDERSIMPLWHLPQGQKSH